MSNRNNDSRSSPNSKFIILITSLRSMSTFEVLSVHHTLTEYVGSVHIPCRHLTSLCPDRCNHAFTSAEFKVLSYDYYEKPGKYGDERQTQFHARLDSNEESRTDYQDSKFSELIRNLVPGQKVKLCWEHIYVNDASTGSKWPERPIRSLELV
jgi:hypothetical protein